MSLKDYKITFADKGYAVNPLTGNISPVVLTSFITAQDINSMKNAINSTIDQFQVTKAAVDNVYSQFFSIKTDFNSQKQFMQSAQDYITTISAGVQDALGEMSVQCNGLASDVQAISGRLDWLKYYVEKSVFSVQDKQNRLNTIDAEVDMQKVYMNEILQIQNERLQNQSQKIDLMMRKLSGQAIEQQKFKMLQLQQNSLDLLQTTILIDFNSNPYLYRNMITDDQISYIDGQVVSISADIQSLPDDVRDEFNYDSIQKLVKRLNGIDFIFGDQSARTAAMCTKLKITATPESQVLGIQVNPGRGGCSLSWGDSASGEMLYMNSFDFRHQYQRYNSYVLTLSGTGYSFRITQGNGMIVQVQNFASSIKSYYRMFEGCENLSGIPSSFELNDLTATAQRMFMGCTHLSADISNIFPEKFIPKFVDLQAMFSGCINVSGKIPSSLYKSPKSIGTSATVKGTVFDHTGCFAMCSGLSNFSSIPSKWK